MGLGFRLRGEGDQFDVSGVQGLGFSLSFPGGPVGLGYSRALAFADVCLNGQVSSTPNFILAPKP